MLHSILKIFIKLILIMNMERSNVLKITLHIDYFNLEYGTRITVISFDQSIYILLYTKTIASGLCKRPEKMMYDCEIKDCQEK